MPYWDDGSGQSKSQYDASGGMDHHGNQNTSGNGNGNTGGNSSKVSTGVKVGSGVVSYAKGNPFSLIAQGANWVRQNIFTKKPSPDYGFDNKGNFIGEGLTRREMRKPPLLGGDDGGNDYGRARQTLNTVSLASTPTADKSYGHQWGFQSYPGTPGTTYDPTQYAKKGKMIYKYGTGQEVKKRSLPPSKGPDSKGLPAILENSDYFTKLIGG